MFATAFVVATAQVGCDAVENDSPPSEESAAEAPGSAAPPVEALAVEAEEEEEVEVRAQPELRLFAGGTEQHRRQCVIRPGGVVYCRGMNANGVLGDGTQTAREHFTPIGQDRAKRSLALGDNVSWAVAEDGTLWRWGVAERSYPRDLPPNLTPQKVETFADWKAISASGSYLYGIRENGTLWMFHHQRVRDARQVGEEEDWELVVTVGRRTCGLRSGELWCWGESGWHHPPKAKLERIGEESDWWHLAGSWQRFCGLRGAGELWCWSPESEGASGVTRVGTESDWRQVSVAHGHTCGVRGDRTVWCWGQNEMGQLGTGSLDGASEPTRLREAPDWTEVGLTTQSSCGLREDGSLWCWGLNPTGLTIDGSLQTPTTPQRIDDFQRRVASPVDEPLPQVLGWDFVVKKSPSTLVLKRFSADGVEELRELEFERSIVSYVWHRELGLLVYTRQSSGAYIEAESLEAIPAAPAVRGALVTRRCQTREWDEEAAEQTFRCNDTTDRLYVLANDRLLTGEPTLRALPGHEIWKEVSIERVNDAANDPGEGCDEAAYEDFEEVEVRYIPEGASSQAGELFLTADDEIWMYRCLLYFQACSDADLLRLHPAPRRAHIVGSLVGRYLPTAEPVREEMDEDFDFGVDRAVVQRIRVASKEQEILAAHQRFSNPYRENWALYFDGKHIADLGSQEPLLSPVPPAAP